MHAAEHADFRAEVRSWLDANAVRRAPNASRFKARMAKTHVTPTEVLAHVEACKGWQRKIFAAGYAGLDVPIAYGGQGRTAAEAAIFRDEAGRYDIETDLFSVGLGMVIPTLLIHGTEAQKRQHLPALLRGDVVWCQLFSEPGAGSDLAGLTTRAVRVDDAWVVDGQKVWNSDAHLAQWGILLARTNWDVPKHRGITYFLLDMATPGVEVRPLRQITGVAHFNETFLTGVRIVDRDVLGQVDGGWAVAHTTLMAERVLIGGAGTGLGFGDFVELGLQYRRNDEPQMRQRLAMAYSRFEILRWLGARAAANEGRGAGAEGSVTKLAVSAHAALNGDLALALQGAEGMLARDDAADEGFWQQLFLSQWAVRIGGGTEQVQRNIIGERVLGLPPEARPDKTAPFRDVPRNG